ncbi:MAG TPA: energy transducer TonB [Candidatus Koribacter sp.]|jgi:TonB family protein
MSLRLVLAVAIFCGLLYAQDPAQNPAPPPDSTKLTVVKSGPPFYPRDAEENRRQGEVIVGLHIREDGSIEQATVVSGDKIFQKSALDCVKRWKLAPYIKNGKPMPVNAEVPIDFIISSQVQLTPKSQIPPRPGATNASSPSGSPQGVKIATPKLIRISQGVSEGLLIRKVMPIYPMDAKLNHLQGSVLLEAIIRKDGLIGNLKVVSGPDEFVQASMDAVSLWRYLPYLFNGEPVEVATTIQVNYQLR